MESTAQQNTTKPVVVARPNRNFLLPMLIADAALLCAPFTVLAFQAVRIDGYDPEKTQLIGILVAIIISVQLPRLINDSIRWLYARRQSLQHHRPLTIPPLLVAVAGVFSVALLSTVFSLSTSLSLWGEASRTQGLLALFFYVILFLQATQLRKRLRTSLIPALLMTAVPVCLWTIIQFIQGADRLLLGSSAGNPNFLSSWLVMILLYCGPQLYRTAAQWTRPFTGRQWRLLGFYTVPIGLVLICLLINASRGALLGLVVGSLFCFVVLNASAKRHKPLLIGGMALLLMGTGYGAASLWVRSTSEGVGNSLTRLLTPYDPVRVTVWGYATTVVTLQADPVFTINRQPDSLALLRPIIGYGLETIEQLQSRFGKLGGLQVAVNSFHNVIFDTLITQGWLGLLTLLLFLECILYGGLHYLGLITYRQIKPWIAWQVGGAVMGVVVALLLIPSSSVGALTPLGAGLGSIGGLLLWLGRQALTRHMVVNILADEQKTLVMAILAVFVAQWIDNQLGFAQASTQPLWWLLLGLLVAVIYEPSSRSLAAKDQPFLTDEVPDISRSTNTIPAASWLVATLVAGLFVVHGFGNLLHSQFTNVEIGSQAIGLLLLLLLMVGLAGNLCHKDAANGLNQIRKTAVSITFRLTLLVLGLMSVWVVFFLIKTALIALSGTRLNTLMAQSNDPNLANQLIDAINPLALHGILLIVIAVLSIILYQRFSNRGVDQAADRPMESGRVWRFATVPLVVLFVSAACLFYSKQYTGGVLHNIANSVAQSAQLVADSPDLLLANAIFEAAATELPANVILRLHWATAITVRINVTLDPITSTALHNQLRALLATVFRDQPFFVNTIEWLSYSENFSTS